MNFHVYSAVVLTVFYASVEFITTNNIHVKSCLSSEDQLRVTSPCKDYKPQGLRSMREYRSLLLQQVQKLLATYRKHRFIAKLNKDDLQLHNVTSWNMEPGKAFRNLQRAYYFLLQIKEGELVIKQQPFVQKTMEKEMTSIGVPLQKLLCKLKKKAGIETLASETMTSSIKCLRMARNITKFSSRAVRILEQMEDFLTRFSS